jgi:hypothetical protein
LIKVPLSNHRYLQSIAPIAETYNINAASVLANSSSQVPVSSTVNPSSVTYFSKVFHSLTAL